MITDTVNLQQRGHELIESALALNHEWRKYHTVTKQTIHPTAWRQQFCTIWLSFGRQTGKTFYIMRHAQENDLVIVGHNATRKYMLNTAIRPLNVLTGADFKRGKSYGVNRPIRTVWIDEPLITFPNVSLLEIYDSVHGDDVTFVILGAPA